MKPLNSKEKRASEFTVIPLGGMNPNSENFGLPTFDISRVEALKLRKENKFEQRSFFGGVQHIGELPVEDFERLAVKDPNAFTIQDLRNRKEKTTEERKKEALKTKEKFKFKKDIEQVDELGTGDPHQIPQTILFFHLKNSMLVYQ